VTDAPNPQGVTLAAYIESTTSPWAPLWALVERSSWQALEVFVSALIGAGALDASVAQAGILAGVAAAITVLANGVPGLAVPAGLPWVVDVGLRTVRSFVSAFLAPIAATAVLPLDVETWQAAALAGAVAGLTVIKSAIAGRFGGDSAATLPARFDVDAQLPLASGGYLDGGEGGR
jgi:hypothetical protein